MCSFAIAGYVFLLVQAWHSGEGGQALTRQLIRYYVIRPRIPMSLPPNLSILIYWFYSCVCFTKVSESSAWPHMAIRGAPWAYHRRFIIVACAFTCPVGLSLPSSGFSHLFLAIWLWAIVGLSWACCINLFCSCGIWSTTWSAVWFFAWCAILWQFICPTAATGVPVIFHTFLLSACFTWISTIPCVSKKFKC